MPEGPSIVILREEAAVFAGCTVARAEGSARLDTSRLVGQVVRGVHSWGKHLLIELDDVSVRIHCCSAVTASTSARSPHRG